MKAARGKPSGSERVAIERFFIVYAMTVVYLALHNLILRLWPWLNDFLSKDNLTWRRGFPNDDGLWCWSCFRADKDGL